MNSCSYPNLQVSIDHMAKQEVKVAVEWAQKEGWTPGIHDAECFLNSDPEGFYATKIAGVSVTENCIGVTEFSNGKQSVNQVDFGNVAPRKGFEPLRTLRSTGSQGPRVNHSATSALF
jgi:hypothetical protein